MSLPSGKLYAIASGANDFIGFHEIPNTTITGLNRSTYGSDLFYLVAHANELNQFTIQQNSTQMYLATNNTAGDYVLATNNSAYYWIVTANFTNNLTGSIQPAENPSLYITLPNPDSVPNDGYGTAVTLQEYTGQTNQAWGLVPL